MSFDIPPFLSYIRSEYLYDLKEGQGYYTSATVFAIIANPGETLKFCIMADDSVVFTHIPVCAIVNSKTAPRLTENDCVFDVCSDDAISVRQFEYLTTVANCIVWKKDKIFWQKGMYIFSVEWKTKQMHLIELEDGNYIFWPNEYLTWGEEIPEKLPEYK